MINKTEVSLHKVLDWKSNKLGNKIVRVQSWKILINSVEVFHYVRDVYSDELTFSRLFDEKYKAIKTALLNSDIDLVERVVHI